MGAHVLLTPSLAPAGNCNPPAHKPASLAVVRPKMGSPAVTLRQTWPDLWHGTQNAESTFQRRCHSPRAGAGLRDCLLTQLQSGLLCPARVPCNCWDQLLLWAANSRPSARELTTGRSSDKETRIARVPAALELEAPTWVKWIRCPTSIGRALHRMHAPNPRQADGARNLPWRDSCADQAAALHDSSLDKGPTVACG